MLRLNFLQLILILSLFFSVLKAQPLKIWMLYAKVTDCNNEKIIPYADIFNESLHTGVYADSLGTFRIKVRTGDTLVLQSFGYLSEVYIISELKDNAPDTFALCPQIHDIGEVLIQLPDSYEAFKHEFLTIEPVRRFKIEGLSEPKIRDIPIMLDTNFLNSDAYAMTYGISYLYYMYSKEEKSKRKVFYLQREARERFIVDEKYNRDIIHDITGLQGDSITDFISFCNFSHQFLYEATPLEIVEEIDRKYKEFRQKYIEKETGILKED